MTTEFNGLDMGLGNLARLSNAKTRSISAENPTGEPGKGGMAVTGTGANGSRELGLGWKVNPCLTLPKQEATVLADIEGSGAIQHIWITVHPKAWRAIILRMYWDGEETPSVEVPVGDFFCMGWCKRANLTSLPVAVNPAGGFNCYWEMPFHKGARIEVENLHTEEIPGFFFQIDYTLTDVPADKGTFHAQWRRTNPLPYGDVYTIVDDIKGKGQYVGTYMAWGSNNNGWWGEGEIKFYMDGDEDFPTICGTGTEDYFGGAWNFEFPEGQYGVFSGNYSGMPQVIKGDGLYTSQQRFGLYRWHIMDPVRFEQNLRVTMQALGWRYGGRYLPLQDDIASTCFWYQTEPHQEFPALPPLNELEVI
jgi:hypothetical protein